MTQRIGVLLDLDQTLVDSSALKVLRDSRRWEEVYRNVDSVRPYSYAKEFLIQLKKSQIPYGIVTSAPRRYAELVLRVHDLPIEVVTAFHDTRRHKPAPDPLLHAMTVMNLHRGIYIGDEERDRAAAAGAGLEFIEAQHSGSEFFREAWLLVEKNLSRISLG